MALPDTSVKHFSSDMPGAPVLSGTAGTLIEVLDACLVNGFGSVSVDSLSVTDNVATAAVSAGHGLSMIGSTGPVILISGATPAGLNGEWRVASVPNSTIFTFATEGVSNGTATGTITAKRSPAGWEKRYSDTNKAVYARTDPAATAMLLRVDDSHAQYPTLVMYESMTDVDTGTGSSGTAYTAKSGAASSAARPWVIVCDRRLGHVVIDSSASGIGASGFDFGDGDPYNSADAFFCLLWGHSAASVNYQPLYIGSQQFKKLARSYTQLGAAISCQYQSGHPNSSSLGYDGLTGMNPADNGLHIRPVEIIEGSYATPTALRGLLPGVWNPATKITALTQGSVYSAFAGLPGRDLIAQRVATANYGALFDITGPWRNG